MAKTRAVGKGEDYLNRQEVSGLRRLATLLLFILLQPLLFVLFGYGLLWAYAAAIVVAAIFGAFTQRQIKGLWEYPCKSVADYLKSCALFLRREKTY